MTNIHLAPREVAAVVTLLLLAFVTDILARIMIRRGLNFATFQTQSVQNVGVLGRRNG